MPRPAFAIFAGFQQRANVACIDNLHSGNGGSTTTQPPRKPLAQFPWIVSVAFKAAPADALLTFLAALLGGVAPGIMLVFAKRAVDAVVQSGSLAQLVPPLLWLGVLLVLSEAVQALRPLLRQRLYLRAWPYLERQVLHKAGALTLTQFDDSLTYDLMQRAANAIGETTQNVFDLLPQVLAAALNIIAALTILVGTSGWLALVASLVVLPLAVAQLNNSTRQYQRNKETTPHWRYVEYLYGLLTERAPATELRAYQLPGFFVQRWKETYTEINRKIFRADALGWRDNEIAMLCQVVANGMALLIVARLIGRGQASLGDAVALTGAVNLLSTNMSMLAGMLGWLMGILLPIGDLRYFLSLPTQERPAGEGRPFPAPLRAPIRFEGVTYQYPGAAAPVLENLTLTLDPGEKIALVGPNGAGKTTLVKLLLGLYEPTAGRITIGGVALREIAPGQLRDHVSCIFQDFARYDLTVGENVAVGRLGASAAAVAAAGEAAGVSEFLAKLPKGYDTLLGKTFEGGTDLSGGQWQRVALARAFVRGADLIILDEPTAALDARAELNLFGRFVELVDGKTAVLISHRLGVARLADRIIVLDGGRVVEDGTHAQLLAAGGLYASLFQAQAQWYETEPEGAVATV